MLVFVGLTMWKDQQMGTFKYDINVEHLTDILFGTGLNWAEKKSFIIL